MGLLQTVVDEIVLKERQPEIRASVGDETDLAALRPAWVRLCGRMDYCEPFQRPEWTEAFIRSHSGCKLVLITLWSGDELYAVMPLTLRPGKIAGLPATVLCVATPAYHGRAGAAVCAEPPSAWVYDRLWAAISSLDWDCFELSRAPEVERTLRELTAKALEQRFLVGVEPLWDSLSISVDCKEVDGEPDWYRRLRPKFRANLRRTEKQLAECGRVELVNCSNADPGMLERFYTLEASGWKGKQGTALAQVPEIRRFYDELAAGAARSGTLSIDFLELDGRPLAAHFAILDGGRYYLLKAAYDESFKRFGPGQLLVQAILRQAGERGIRELDFVAERSWDEERWAPRELAHFQVFMFRPSLYGRLLYSLRFPLRKTLKKFVSRQSDSRGATAPDR